MAVQLDGAAAQRLKGPCSGIGRSGEWIGSTKAQLSDERNQEAARASHFRRTHDGPGLLDSPKLNSDGVCEHGSIVDAFRTTVRAAGGPVGNRVVRRNNSATFDGLMTSSVPMDEPSADLWRQLPFSAAEEPELQDEAKEQTAERSQEEAQQGPSSCWLEHFTYRDYQLLPCTYVIRPSDMMDDYSSLDSHSDYQGFLETMPLNYPPKKYQSPRLRLTENPEEEELVKMAKRVGLIQHLPTGSYDGCRKNRECVICMMEFSLGEGVRYLPCMHTYHIECINSWLMRSFVCPSCLEPVDAALLTSYETN